MVALAWLVSMSALAQGTRAEYLKLFDTNGNGRVSEAEYVTYMTHGFRAMDTNGDGIIETNELPGSRGHPITLLEYQDNLRRQFHRLDRHHHGYLNAGELTAPPG